VVTDCCCAYILCTVTQLGWTRRTQPLTMSHERHGSWAYIHQLEVQSKPGLAVVVWPTHRIVSPWHNSMCSH